MRYFASGLIIGLRQDCDEFIASHARNDINPAQLKFEGSRNNGQQGIAGLMSGCIVDAFEVIQIHIEERERPPGPCQPIQFHGCCFYQRSAVQDAC